LGDIEHRRYTTLGNGYRLLLATLLVLLAAAGLKSAKPAHAAKTLKSSSPHPRHRRLRTLSWRVATRFPRPRFEARRTINVNTAGGFWRAWRRLRPNEKIVVHGVTFTGEAILANKQLPAWAEVHFDRGTRFVGVPGADNAPAVWINNLSHVRFYGGDVSDRASGGKAGTGIVVYDSSYLTWWGFRVHDTGGGGVFLTGIKKASDHLDFKGDVTDWGNNLAWDTHPTKGTGQQGVNVADANYGVNNSRLAFHVHNGAVGSGMEIGGSGPTDGARGNTIYLWCQNLTRFAANGGAGNCAQVWGENVIRNEFKYLVAKNLAGRPYHTAGMYANQSLATDRVVYGRASRTNRNGEAFGKVRWDPHCGTVFVDVRPRQ
jgi:hypothetical protein